MTKLTDKQRDAVMRGKHVAALAEAVGRFIAESLAPLEARIAELEARPQVKYAGVWKANADYGPGTFVTHAGSLWAANVPVKGVAPGTTAGAWTLAVKRGRDRR